MIIPEIIEEDYSILNKFADALAKADQSNMMTKSKLKTVTDFETWWNKIGILGATYDPDLSMQRGISKKAYKAGQKSATMTKSELKAMAELLILFQLMSNDPYPADNETYIIIQGFLTRKAKELGYEDWIDALND